jgi:hypothetical protein
MHLNREITLAFYTSMQGRNAEPAIDKLAGAGWRERGVRLYDRSFQKDDPTGAEKWDTMRDLDKVWSTEAEVHKQMFGTVLVFPTDIYTRGSHWFPRFSLQALPCV